VEPVVSNKFAIEQGDENIYLVGSSTKPGIINRAAMPEEIIELSVDGGIMSSSHFP
jgi:hypothetical protein